LLKLIKCEFWKLKRKRLLYALMSLSLFFPLILAYMAKAGTGADTTEHYLQTRFDYVYTMMLGYGLVFLLPCLIGIIAAILFFIERDCDTSKNLRTIPVTNTQLIIAKISMLFIFSIAFCLTSTLSVALFCKLFHVGMVYGMTYKIFMSLIFGVLIVAASLPIVFLIICFNKSFLLSILLAFFYSIFNWGILGTVGTSISAAKIAFLNSFPVICVMNWTNKYYRAYAEVQKSNVNSPNFHNRDRYSICGGRNGVSSPHLPPLFLFVCILVFCLSAPDNMSRIRSVAKE